MTDLNVVVKDFVAESVNAVLESNTFEHALQVAADSAVREAIEECNIGRSVEKAIEDAIDDAAQTAVEDAVGNYDFETHVKEDIDFASIVADVIDIEEITRAVGEAIDIDRKIEGKLDVIAIEVRDRLSIDVLVHQQLDLIQKIEALQAANEELSARLKGIKAVGVEHQASISRAFDAVDAVEARVTALERRNAEKSKSIFSRLFGL
jgi:hypothetical protein